MISKKKFFLLILLINYLFLPHISYSNKLSKKLLVGAGRNIGFYAPDNSDYYITENIPAQTVNPGTGDINFPETTARSLNHNFKFNYSFDLGISFDYFMQSGFFYGFEVNYFQFKAIDWNLTDDNDKEIFFKLKNKNIMLHGGYNANIGLIYPYFKLGVGIDLAKFLGYTMINLNGVDTPHILGDENDNTYGTTFNRGSAYLSTGILFNIYQDVFVDLSYKMLTFFNIDNGVISTGERDSKLGNITLKKTIMDFYKLTLTSHMIGFSLRFAI